MVFLNLRPSSGNLAWTRLVVDGDLGAFDVLVDDGQHGRLLPRQGHRVLDHVLEEVAELGGDGGGADALPRVDAAGGSRLNKSPLGAGQVPQVRTAVVAATGQGTIVRRSRRRKDRGKLSLEGGPLPPRGRIP